MATLSSAEQLSTTVMATSTPCWSATELRQSSRSSALLYETTTQSTATGAVTPLRVRAVRRSSPSGCGPYSVGYPGVAELRDRLRATLGGADNRTTGANTVLRDSCPCCEAAAETAVRAGPDPWNYPQPKNSNR